MCSETKFKFDSPVGWELCHKILKEWLPFGPHDYCTNTTYSSCYVIRDAFEEMDNSSNLPETFDILENSSLQRKFLAYFGQMQVPHRGIFFEGLSQSSFSLGRVTSAKSLLFRQVCDA